MKRKSQTIFCPYCGKPAILRKASDIYKTHTLEEYLYACSDYPACDAYVGVHRGTLLLKGSLANKERRRKRIVAHRYFDSIWRHGIRNRKNAYFWLQDIFGLTSDQVISASKRVLETKSPDRKSVV